MFFLITAVTENGAKTQHSVSAKTEGSLTAVTETETNCYSCGYMTSDERPNAISETTSNAREPVTIVFQLRPPWGRVTVETEIGTSGVSEATFWVNIDILMYVVQVRFIDSV